jgi:hypothetical protein
MNIHQVKLSSLMNKVVNCNIYIYNLSSCSERKKEEAATCTEDTKIVQIREHIFLYFFNKNI